MNRFSRKILSSIVSTSVIVMNQCDIKANFDINLDQLSNDLSKYGTDEFDKILHNLENGFISNRKDILELDESWKNADKRIKYLYYKVIDKLLEEIPIFKKAIKDLNGVMKQKLTFKTRNDTCVVSYKAREHSFGASLSDNEFDTWNAINDLGNFGNIQLDPSEYIPKFNRGEFFLPFKNPNALWISDKSSVLDKYVSNKMLVMSNWNNKKREIANLVNTIIHESGHLLHEFFIRGDDLDGVYRDYWINEVGLENLYINKYANWEWAGLRSQIYVNINGSKLTNFINFLILLHVLKENNINIKKKETFEVSDMSWYAYNYQNILRKELSKNDEIKYGHLSGRAMDDSNEFIAELWVATIGCGVRENSWGRVFRNYLKMMFGNKCLGAAGNSWYNG